MIAAERINARVSGVQVTPHHCRIEEKGAEWYQQFTVIVLGLDSLEARRYMNSVVCSFLGESAGGRGGSMEFISEIMQVCETVVMLVRY